MIQNFWRILSKKKEKIPTKIDIAPSKIRILKETREKDKTQTIAIIPAIKHRTRMDIKGRNNCINAITSPTMAITSFHSIMF